MKITYNSSKLRILLVLFTISLFFLQCEKDEMIEPPAPPVAKEKPLTLARSALPGAEVEFKNAYIEVYKTAISQTYDSVLKSGKYNEKQFELALKRAFDENPVLKSHKHSQGKQKLSKEGLTFWKKMEKGFPIKYKDFINRLGQMSLIIKHSRRISPVEKQILYHRIAELEARSEVYKDNYKKIDIIRNIRFLRKNKELSVESKSLKAPLKMGETVSDYGGGFGGVGRVILSLFLKKFAETHPNGSYPFGRTHRMYITVSGEDAIISECPYGLVFNPKIGSCDFPDSTTLDEVIVVGKLKHKDKYRWWDPLPKDTFREGYDAGYSYGYDDGEAGCFYCYLNKVDMVIRHYYQYHDYQYIAGFDAGYSRGYNDGINKKRFEEQKRREEEEKRLAKERKKRRNNNNNGDHKHYNTNTSGGNTNNDYDEDIELMIINLYNPITGDPIDFYLIAKYKNGGVLDLSSYSIYANTIKVGDYSLTPHYDSDKQLVFYAACRYCEELGIEYIIRADALDSFKNKIKLYTHAANLFYFGGFPSKGQVAMVAGDYWKGLKQMWGDALKSPTYYLYLANVFVGVATDLEAVESTSTSFSSNKINFSSSTLPKSRYTNITINNRTLSQYMEMIEQKYGTSWVTVSSKGGEWVKVIETGGVKYSARNFAKNGKFKHTIDYIRNGEKIGKFRFHN